MVSLPLQNFKEQTAWIQITDRNKIRCKSSEKTTVKLHQNVPVAGKRVDCETATKIFW